MVTREFSKMYNEIIFPRDESKILENDPEFSELFYNFVFDDVIKQNDLEDRTRIMATLATLIGCQGISEFKVMLPVALKLGVTPVEVKEIVYQSVAYLGIGRIRPFLKVTNDIFEKEGVKLPLDNQSTTNKENRLEKGIQAQVDIFGEGMKEFYKSGPEESRHINYWLAENCFGDYYTRTGLNHKEREMITFCFLSAQGGCEIQLISHVLANIRLGNDKEFLIKIISQCLPFIGYPRSLNTLRCVNNAVENMKEK